MDVFDTLANRTALLQLLPKNPRVLELGVAAGAFARSMLLAREDLQYYGIDRWADHHGTSEMIRALEVFVMLALFDRVHIVRATFAEAVTVFPENYFDMVYVDGYAHTGQEGGQTLRDWWPKVKHGGIFAGHDYHERWPETVEAVNKWSQQAKRTIHRTRETLPEFPSWWTHKPAKR